MAAMTKLQSVIVIMILFSLFQRHCTGGIGDRSPCWVVVRSLTRHHLSHRYGRTSPASYFAFNGMEDYFGTHDEEDGEEISVQNDNQPETRPFSRSVYQVYPIRPGSSRPMPPSVSDNYFSSNRNHDDINAVDSSEQDMTNLEWKEHNLEDNISTETRTFQTIPVQELHEQSTMMDNVVSEKSIALATPSPSISSEREITSPFSKDTNRIVPRVTPSFMEPIKYKALKSGLSTSNDSLNTTDSYQRTLPIQASDGKSGTPYLTTLSRQLEHLTQRIYQLNNGVEFNINSPKQVAQVLFGEDDSSTSKDVLEALASAGNEMASCIYKHRKLIRDIKREERRLEQQLKGDKKNDYFGNVARKNHRKRMSENEKSQPEESTSSATIMPDETNNNDAAHHRREPLLLIDASAYIFRAYHAIPPLHRSDGTPTGALHGVCRMLQNLLLTRLLKGDRPRVVLAFDYRGPNFRHDIYSDYKANRGPCPVDLEPQFGLVREAADAFGIVQVEAEGYEADDVIATLTRQALNDGIDVDVLSGDKDLMQLITPSGIEPSVHMIDPLHFDRIDHDDVVERWGVSSDKLGDVLALAGDSSDNIPGAPGIGPKTAAALINEFGSLENLIKGADTIKQKKRRESLMDNAEKVLLFRKLVSLDDFIPRNKMSLHTSFQNSSDFRMSSFDSNRLIAFYKRMELHSCETQLESRLRSDWSRFKRPPSPDDVQGVPF